MPGISNLHSYPDVFGIPVSKISIEVDRSEFSPILEQVVIFQIV